MAQPRPYLEDVHPKVVSEVQSTQLGDAICEAGQDLACKGFRSW